MRRSKAEGKRSLRELSEEEEEEEETEDEDTFEEEEALEKKQKGKATSSSGVCQVESCTADMSKAKQYHKRHKVCQFHAKAPHVRISGLHQRFFCF